jgi:hypothetical protein
MMGYLSKGLVYGTVGFLALSLAVGRGGETADREEAVRFWARLPFGSVLLAFLAVGLFGMVAWRLVQAFRSRPGEKKLLRRSMMLVSGILYGALAVSTVHLLLEGPASKTGEAGPELTARLMRAPFGQALIIAAGLAIVVYGIYEAMQGIQSKFERKLQLHALSSRGARWVRHVSRFGLVARGFVFCLMGSFLVQAALRADPRQAKGLGGTLRSLAAQPYGSVLLAICALGLIAFAAYAGIEARYRKFGD